MVAYNEATYSIDLIVSTWWIMYGNEKLWCCETRAAADFMYQCIQEHLYPKTY